MFLAFSTKVLEKPEKDLYFTMGEDGRIFGTAYPRPSAVAKVTGTNKDDTVARAPKRREGNKIYPNDPCPCGSGKKYKQCHGRAGAKA